MCGDGLFQALMLDHGSTALDKKQVYFPMISEQYLVDITYLQAAHLRQSGFWHALHFRHLMVLLYDFKSPLCPGLATTATEK